MEALPSSLLEKILFLSAINSEDSRTSHLIRWASRIEQPADVQNLLRLRSISRSFRYLAAQVEDVMWDARSEGMMVDAVAQFVSCAASIKGFRFVCDRLDAHMPERFVSTILPLLPSLMSVEVILLDSVPGADSGKVEVRLILEQLSRQCPRLKQCALHFEQKTSMFVRPLAPGSSPCITHLLLKHVVTNAVAIGSLIESCPSLQVLELGGRLVGGSEIRVGHGSLTSLDLSSLFGLDWVVLKTPKLAALVLEEGRLAGKAPQLSRLVVTYHCCSTLEASADLRAVLDGQVSDLRVRFDRHDSMSDWRHAFFEIAALCPRLTALDCEAYVSEAELVDLGFWATLVRMLPSLEQLTTDASVWRTDDRMQREIVARGLKLEKLRALTVRAVEVADIDCTLIACLAPQLRSIALDAFYLDDEEDAALEIQART
jgi:hypothetical protein